MRPQGPTKLRVQDGTEIDLTTSGSMLAAGKTRSGKTTGIIALLLQALQCGRDVYGSECIIIDPKQAELSRLPHVVTLDADGEAKAILAALRWFEHAIAKRQRVFTICLSSPGMPLSGGMLECTPRFCSLTNMSPAAQSSRKRPQKIVIIV